MRKAIKESDSAKVLNGYEVYQGLTEKARTMGADLEKFPSPEEVPNLLNQVVNVLSYDVEAGYTLVETKEGKQYLLADEYLERQRGEGEITYLLIYPNGSTEEFDDLPKAEAKYRDYIIKGNFKMTERCIVYTVTAKKELKATLATSFE